MSATEDSRGSSPHVLSRALQAVGASSDTADRTLMFTADLGASWASYICGLSVAHPVDTLRVRWQVHGMGPVHALKRDGVRSLFAGVAGPALVMAPMTAVTFALFEACRVSLARQRWLRSTDSELSRDVPPDFFSPLPRSGFSTAETLVGGAIGGLFAAQVLVPVSVVRTQQQVLSTEGRTAPRTLDMYRRLWSHEGVRGLFRGGVPTVIGNGLIGRGVFFASYDSAKHFVGTTWLGQHGAADFIAAAMTTVAYLAMTFPIDFVATRLMGDRLGALEDREFGGKARNVVTSTLKTRGVRGFFRGFSLALVRSTAWTVVQLPVYDALKPVFRATLAA